MSHPNTIAALITTALAALILRIAQRYGYAHMTDEEALGVAGGIIAAVLFVGRRGLRYLFVGLWTGLWHGSPKPSQPVQPPTEPAP